MFKKLLEVSNSCNMETKYGLFRMRVFKLENETGDVLCIPCIYLGNVRDECLVRFNSACFTSEVFGDQKCDCKWQLDKALEMIAAEGSGLVVYLPHHEGRGIGLFNKTETMRVMDRQSMSTKAAFESLGFRQDYRTFDCTVPILRWFSINKFRSITNNPRKMDGFSDLGINVSGIVPIVSDLPIHREYLITKKNEMAHHIMFDIQDKQ